MSSSNSPTYSFEVNQTCEETPGWSWWFNGAQSLSVILTFRPLQNRLYVRDMWYKWRKCFRKLLKVKKVYIYSEYNDCQKFPLTHPHDTVYTVHKKGGIYVTACGQNTLGVNSSHPRTYDCIPHGFMVSWETLSFHWSWNLRSGSRGFIHDTEVRIRLGKWRMGTFLTTSVYMSLSKLGSSFMSLSPRTLTIV